MATTRQDVLLIDVIYLSPWLYAVFTLRTLPNLFCAIILLAFAAGWYQEWTTSRLATKAFSDLLFLDVFGAVNYAGWIYSIQLPPVAPFPANTRVAIHWAVMFLIAAWWNWMAAQRSDPKARKVLLRFIGPMFPGTAAAVLISCSSSLAFKPSTWLATGLFTLVALNHVGLIIAWHWLVRRKSRIPMQL